MGTVDCREALRNTLLEIRNPDVTLYRINNP